MSTNDDLPNKLLNLFLVVVVVIFAFHQNFIHLLKLSNETTYLSRSDVGRNGLRRFKLQILNENTSTTLCKVSGGI